MRAVAALVIALAIALVAAVAEGHVHAVGHGPDHCAVCVLRSVDAPASASPEPVRPDEREAGEVAAFVGSATVCGAPLGAIPGQSPPASA